MAVSLTDYSKVIDALSFIDWGWIFCGRVALRRLETVWVEYDGSKQREIFKKGGIAPSRASPVSLRRDRNGHYRFDVREHEHLRKAKKGDWVIVYGGFLRIPMPDRTINIPLTRAAVLGVTTETFLGEKIAKCPECYHTMIFGPVPEPFGPLNSTSSYTANIPSWYHVYHVDNPARLSNPSCSIDAAQQEFIAALNGLVLPTLRSRNS